MTNLTPQYDTPACPGQSDLTEDHMAQIRAAEAATAGHVARLNGEREVTELPAEQLRGLVALMTRIDRQRLNDGRLIEVDGRLTSRPLTEDEVASGRYPLAAIGV